MLYSSNPITAEILDAAITEGYLAIRVEDEIIRAEITETMLDTAEALPQLVEELEKAGYRFYSEPTDAAGEVELVKARH